MAARLASSTSIMTIAGSGGGVRKRLRITVSNACDFMPSVRPVPTP